MEQLIPLLQTFGEVCPGFKSQDEPPCLHPSSSAHILRFTSGATPVILFSFSEPWIWANPNAKDHGPGPDHPTPSFLSSPAGGIGTGGGHDRYCKCRNVNGRLSCLDTKINAGKKGLLQLLVALCNCFMPLRVSSHRRTLFLAVPGNFILRSCAVLAGLSIFAYFTTTGVIL